MRYLYCAPTGQTQYCRYRPRLHDTCTPNAKTPSPSGNGVLGGQGGNRTPDTWIFSPLLYRLSYLTGEERKYRLSGSLLSTNVLGWGRFHVSFADRLDVAALAEHCECLGAPVKKQVERAQIRLKAVECLAIRRVM